MVLGTLELIQAGCWFKSALENLSVSVSLPNLWSQVGCEEENPQERDRETEPPQEGSARNKYILGKDPGRGRLSLRDFRSTRLKRLKQ